MTKLTMRQILNRADKFDHAKELKVKYYYVIEDKYLSRIGKDLYQDRNQVVELITNNNDDKLVELYSKITERTKGFITNNLLYYLALLEVKKTDDKYFNNYHKEKGRFDTLNRYINTKLKDIDFIESMIVNSKDKIADIVDEAYEQYTSNL